ncbi:PREDICTED: uncharacterized protein LOC109206110 [Nicotiana attenuata]|uniref:uncharacterized protein LOC109206110 n=1 Tax=Nicotiana attenuata TaxID=49451 RepID=UPI00090546A1|nr:PREDICTED: uncharacterized protein LOC109206110 [Nicotiana attenuata]
MNGAVEAANKNIKRILRKIVDNHRQWNGKLSFALLGYRTIMRTSTGATPYMLVYGTKVLIPAKVKIPSLRVIQEAKLDDAEWIRVREEQLMLINEKRMDAIGHGQIYQIGWLAQQKGETSPIYTWAVGFEKILPHQKEAKGKSAPNWQGPYVVHRVLSGGALILAEMDGTVIRKPINSDTIKKYYI